MSEKSLPESVQRVVIENVQPQIDGGRFPIKRTEGETVVVTADLFADGHDSLRAILLYRRIGEDQWKESPMENLGNDRFQGIFSVGSVGNAEYTVQAWIDRFDTWLLEIQKKFGAAQDVTSELLEGSEIISSAADRASGKDAHLLRQFARDLISAHAQADRIKLAVSPELSSLMIDYADRIRASSYDRILKVKVDPVKARFGAWYEMFPRSASPDPNGHGTLKDTENKLKYIAGMGFDVLYLPPVHPIGKSFRKGPNNTLNAGPKDVGSPWAIGSKEGGHTSVHPMLGTFADFDSLVESARRTGIDIALDIAFQCSPDHPWVRQHPQWFRHRPDGTIKYAENPPKKYQDIYPLDFECEDWKNLWQALKEVFLFWIGHGVRIFRVDNPHTKAFHFWEWVIVSIQQEHPDTIFLAEAFTRPKVMRYLAKCGFTQSYTYFTWRNTKYEITEYFRELTQTDVREYMRPNLFANTPDIFHEYLQTGGHPAYMIRLVLAATLGASYGIYGPPFELCETHAVPGTEEYLDSEKYQIRNWNPDAPGNIRELITRVNRIRKENQALQFDHSLRFHNVENEHLLCYSKRTEDFSNVILVVVNLDPHHRQSGWVHLPLSELGLGETVNYQVHDLLSEARYLWHGKDNYVELDPQSSPAHIFRIRRKIKTERDFDYYL